MKSYLKKFELKNKVSYVMGGNGLIGTEVSKALSSAGSQTIILDIDSTKGIELVRELEKSSNRANFELLDCTDMEKLEENFAFITNKHGAPDVFINCSYPRTKDWGQSSFQEIPLKSFRKNVDIHMNSYSWLAKLFADKMIENAGGGSIIQFGSTYGVLGQDLTVYEGTDMKENMTYAAIKGGITNLTRLMASYYGKYNIRINTICPGGISGHVAGTADTQNPIFVKQYNQKTPLKRLGKPEEIASAVLFLASDAASYITGATIMADGGWSCI